MVSLGIDEFERNLVKFSEVEGSGYIYMLRMGL